MFSKRRVAIERELVAVGATGERAAQTASLKTRQPKDRNIALADLVHAWQDEATRAGIDLRHLPAARTTASVPTTDELAAALVLDRATFTFPDVVATTAALSPNGATLHDIDHTARTFLESPLAVPLTHDGRWTTVEILDLERRSIDTARCRQTTGAGTVAERTLAGPSGPGRDCHTSNA